MGLKCIKSDGPAEEARLDLAPVPVGLLADAGVGHDLIAAHGLVRQHQHILLLVHARLKLHQRVPGDTLKHSAVQSNSAEQHCMWYGIGL